MDKKAGVALGLIIGVLGLVWLYKKPGTEPPPDGDGGGGDITFTNPVATAAPYNPLITAWAIVTYSVTMKNNTGQAINRGYKRHVKVYQTGNPGTITKEYDIPNTDELYMPPPPEVYWLYVDLAPGIENTVIAQYSMNYYTIFKGETAILYLIDELGNETTHAEVSW